MITQIDDVSGVATIAAGWRLTTIPGAHVRAIATAAVKPSGLHMHTTRRTPAAQHTDPAVISDE